MSTWAKAAQIPPYPIVGLARDPMPRGCDLDGTAPSPERPPALQSEVHLRFGVGIDAGHGQQTAQVPGHRVHEMSRGVGGGDMHRIAAGGELHSDGRSARSLTHSCVDAGAG